MSVFAAALSLVITAEEPIGRLGEAEFLSLFTKMGYTRYSTSQKLPTSPIKKIRSGSSEFLVGWTHYMDKEGEPAYIGSFTAYAEFNLPRSFSKAAFASWLKKEGLAHIAGSSYLGGRIAIQADLYDQDTSFNSLTERTNKFVSGLQKVKKLAESLGGHQVNDLLGQGPAKLDPSFTIDWVEARDVESLRDKMGWSEGPSPGGGKGWVSSIQIGRVPIYVNGMMTKGPVALICSGQPNKAAAAKFSKTPSDLAWADVQISAEYVQFRTMLDSGKGITVREMTEKIETFARKIKELNIF